MQIVLFIATILVILVTAYLYYYGKNLFADELNQPRNDAQHRVQDELFKLFAETKNPCDDVGKTKASRDKNFYLFNNITLPLEGGFLKTDHLLVTTQGIFMLDTLHCDGLVRYTKKTGFTQEQDGRIERLYQPVSSPRQQLDKLSRFLPELSQQQIHHLLVFTGDSEFNSLMPPHVIKLEALAGRVSRQEPILSYQQILGIIGKITTNRLNTYRQDQQKNNKVSNH